MDNFLSRTGPLLTSDKSRVLLRRMYPSSHEIAQRIIEQVVNQSDEAIAEQISSLFDYFADRHENVHEAFINRYREVRGNLGAVWTYNENRKLLIGAHFMMEYSIESAALFNPSVVPHFDQTGLPDGSVRFILSLRATGEGHVSSVTFRQGVLTREGRVRISQQSPHIREPSVISMGGIKKEQFVEELHLSSELTRAWNDDVQKSSQHVLSQLPDMFGMDDIRRACGKTLQKFPGISAETACDCMLLFSEANYTVCFPRETTISERVLFPVTPTQSKGIEDARFVLFTEDDGTQKYYAIFISYNGRSSVPQLLVTTDFTELRFVTLTGDISNKGMALFPRRINGKYVTLSRQDDVNVLIMFSESLLKWEDPQVLMKPEQPWEFLKIGNCGSPVETSKGWLVLTHGVGSLRQYCIGAALLDIDDPTKVIARLKAPLIRPNELEREGYVPNVAYTCGAMINHDLLLVPYACSDSFSSFATVSLPKLWKAMGVK